jgi:hypothetical protein
MRRHWAVMGTSHPQKNPNHDQRHSDKGINRGILFSSFSEKRNDDKSADPSQRTLHALSGDDNHRRPSNRDGNSNLAFLSRIRLCIIQFGILESDFNWQQPELYDEVGGERICGSHATPRL